MTETEVKQECEACGSTDYERYLRECPYCGRTKCDACDMGDNVSCVACDEE